MSSRILVVYSPRQVAGHRYLGDKRSGVVYDLAAVSSEGGESSSKIGGGEGGWSGEGGGREIGGGEGGGRSDEGGGESGGGGGGGESSSKIGGGEKPEGGLALRLLVDELLASERYICFAPDTLAEARNRGYRLYSRRSLRKALRRI